MLTPNNHLVWSNVAPYIANWSSFIQTCKAFNLLNTPEMALLKYDKLRSFLKRYPSLMDLLMNELALSSKEWSSILPDCLSNLSYGTPHLDESYRSYLAESSFKSAHQVVQTTFYNRLLDSTERVYLRECYDILGSRPDLNTKRARLIPKTSLMFEHFIEVATANTSLSLLDIKRLRRTNCLWIRSPGISKRSNLTFKEVKEHPDIWWDYHLLLRRLALKDQEVEYLLNKIEAGVGGQALIHLNPFITWDQTIRYMYDKRVNVESWLLAKSVTYDKVKCLKEKAIECQVYYLAILLNPSLTFEQTNKLIELKGPI